MNVLSKKKVLLFNSPIIQDRLDPFEMQEVFPRIGIASIAAYLLENGIGVKIVDPAVDSLEEIESAIVEFKPRIVGIPAFTSEIHSANFTAKFVKEINPKIFTIVGGAHCSALPKRTLEEFDYFDAAAISEGELTMLNLVLGRPISAIDGITYRKDGDIIVNPPAGYKIIDLDELPQPAWHLYNLEKYRQGGVISGFGKKKKKLELPVEGARGCPFNCNFCFRINGKGIRFKSPEKITEEVERNVEEFGADSIFFVEGTFAVDKEGAYKMCEKLIDKGLNKKITWSTGGRVNVLDERLLRKMKESGCIFLGYGVESGVQEILKSMGKAITIEQIVKSFNLCRMIGIKTEANFILGHLGETEETINQTIKFARKLKADFANFAIMVPFPGTDIFRMAEREENNFRIKTYDWRLYGKQIGAALEIQHLPTEKLIKLQNRAYLNFYLTPKRFWKLIFRLNTRRFRGITERLFPFLKKFFKAGTK